MLSEPSPKTQSISQSGQHTDTIETEPIFARNVALGTRTNRSLVEVVSDSIAPRPQYNLSGYSFRTAIERRGFEFFKERCMPYMLRFAVVSDWIDIALKSSFDTPAVREILLAIAFVHMGRRGAYLGRREETTAQMPTFASYQYYMKHYGRALRLLSHATPSTSLVLVCCLMFHCCEHFAGRHLKAFEHIKSGMKLLSSRHHTVSSLNKATGSSGMGHCTSPASVLLTDSIVPEFDGIVKIPVYKAWEPLMLNGAAQMEALQQHNNTCSSVSFQSSIEARDALDRILASLFAQYYRENLPQAAVLVDSRCSDREAISSWLSAFQTFQKQVSKSQRLYPDPDLLQIHHNLALIILKLSSYNHRTDSEHHQAQKLESLFESLLQQCQGYILIAGGLEDSSGLDSPWLGMDLGLIPPLYFISIVCRATGLRRQACNLLHRVERYENAWNGCLAAKIAEAVIHLEEQGLGFRDLAGQIPDAYRIMVVGAERCSATQIFLKYTRAPHHDVEYIELIDHTPMALDVPAVAWPVDGYLTKPGYQGLCLYRKARCRCSQIDRAI